MNNGTIFNIDFAYILGEKLTGLDASKIAIDKKFVKILGDKKWNEFLELVVKILIVSCRLILLAVVSTILSFSEMLYSLCINIGINGINRSEITRHKTKSFSLCNLSFV